MVSSTSPQAGRCVPIRCRRKSIVRSLARVISFRCGVVQSAPPVNRQRTDNSVPAGTTPVTGTVTLCCGGLGTTLS